MIAWREPVDACRASGRLLAGRPAPLLDQRLDVGDREHHAPAEVQPRQFAAVDRFRIEDRPRPSIRIAPLVSTAIGSGSASEFLVGSIRTAG